MEFLFSERPLQRQGAVFGGNGNRISLLLLLFFFFHENP